MLYEEDVREIKHRLDHLLDDTTLDDSQHDELTYRIAKLEELMDGMEYYNAKS